MSRTHWIGVGILILAAGIGVAVWKAAKAVPPVDNARILHPPDGAVLPSNLSAPLIRWTAGAGPWNLTIRFGARTRIVTVTGPDACWQPEPAWWREVVAQSAGKDILLQVGSGPESVVHLEHEPLDAPLFFREVPLPFSEAVKDPSRIVWRFGSIATTEPPAPVLQGLPVCGNCHSFSADGRTLGMDVDYANDKGSYVIAPVTRTIDLTRERILTWSDYRRDEGTGTFGLLSQVSPDGRYVISTVKDRSIFMARTNLAFSQLFFPIKGILAVFDTQTRQITPLPGADDPRYAQSNPVWSPDGQFIVFARASAHDLKNLKHPESALVTEAEAAEFFRDNPRYGYDLFRVPFNSGRGGVAEPLIGASGGGTSHFFPRYSPDGRWIVFCRARDFMLLQPDSELWVIPSGGGDARRLRCNTSRMNSWHTFSPDGRWLAFATKAWGPYTRIALARFYGDGQTSPAVTLFQLTAGDRAANIPEFVNQPAGAIAQIRERFMDDVSYVRAGTDLFNGGDAGRAEAMFRRATVLNPTNETAHFCLGNALAQQGRFSDALVSFARAETLMPRDVVVCRRGQVLRQLGHLPEAREALERAVLMNPNHLEAQTELGKVLYELGLFQEAVSLLGKVAQRAPDQVEVRFSLAVALWHAGDVAAAKREASVALSQSIDPEQMEQIGNLLRVLR